MHRLTEAKKIKIFLKLFGGLRDDVYAKRTSEGFATIRSPLTPNDIVRHFRGDLMLAAYPLTFEGRTPWIVADFDDHQRLHHDELEDKAFKLALELQVSGVDPLINISKSGHGYHVRIPFAVPQMAWQARQFMQEALRRADVMSTKEVPIEIFPAQDLLDDRSNAVGNPLAMPLCMKQAEETNGGTQLVEIQNDGFRRIPFGHQTWRHLAAYRRITPYELLEVISDWGASSRVLESHFDNPDFSIEPRHRNNELTEEDIYLIRDHCHFVKMGMNEPLAYMHWISLAAILAPFEHRGREMFHEISSMDQSIARDGTPRYQYEKANKQFDMMGKYSPTTCMKLADRNFVCPEMGEDGQCDLFRSDESDRGPKSPAAIPFFKKHLKRRGD